MAFLMFPEQVFSQTTSAPMLTGLAGWEASPKFTIGETLNGWTPPGKIDGLGARRVGPHVEVFMNHELAPADAHTYTLQNGLGLKGARITKFVMDAATREIISAGPAYQRIYDRAGVLVTNATQINEGTSSIEGLDRLCSASLYKAGTFGLVDDLFFSGEEADNGQAFILDIENDDLHCAPWLGRAKWENVTFLASNDPDKVALLVGDDTQQAPLYLYMGDKDHIGDNSFLDRNGLAHGTLYVFVTDNGLLSPQQVNGTGTRFSGSFQPIAHYAPALAGTAGYDALGFASQNQQYALGNAIGMFRFSRPEDLATDPYDPTRAVYASTGRGWSYPADDWGTTYIVDVDFPSLSVDMHIIYDGDDAGDGQFTHADHGLRNPDNVEWGRDGMIYIQEDKGTNLNVFGGVSGMEASIWAMDSHSGSLERIAMVDRTAPLPFQQFDVYPSDLGNWETSGILDVTHLFEDQEKVVLLTTVQAHSVHGGAIAHQDLNEGGQLLMLNGPTLTNLVISVHGYLNGAYDISSGLMRDDLRALGSIPLQHPYTVPPYAPDGIGTIHPSVLNTTGPDAIVDWVLLELRDGTEIVVEQRAALIQRDGDIVDIDGTSAVRFKSMAAGLYHVVLRHRNHLGVMTAESQYLGTIAHDLDLGAAGTATHGTNAQKSMGNVRMLWAGDVNGDGVIRYSGAGNDRDPILLELGGTIPTTTITGYKAEDLDLDGAVKYTGTNNDKDVILQSIGGTTPTLQVFEQVP